MAIGVGDMIAEDWGVGKDGTAMLGLRARRKNRGVWLSAGPQNLTAGDAPTHFSIAYAANLCNRATKILLPVLYSRYVLRLPLVSALAGLTRKRRPDGNR